MGRRDLPVVPLVTGDFSKKSSFHAGSQLLPFTCGCSMSSGLAFRATRRGQVVRLESILELGKTLSLNANLGSTNFPVHCQCHGPEVNFLFVAVQHPLA
jgi:hypothetical protein